MAAPRTAEQRADLVRIEGVIASVRQVGNSGRRAARGRALRTRVVCAHTGPHAAADVL